MITSATKLSFHTKCLKIKSQEYKTNTRDTELSRRKKNSLYRVKKTVELQMGNENYDAYKDRNFSVEAV